MVSEQRDLVLIVLCATCLAFHGADLWPRDLWVRVWEEAVSHHVAGLATSETSASNSRSAGTIDQHGIASTGRTRHDGRGRGAGLWLGQDGVGGRCQGTGQCCWGEAGLGEGGTVGCGQNRGHGVLLGIQPLSECLPLHVGLWHW